MRRSLGLAALITGGLLVATIGSASADPVPASPGTYPATNSAGGTPVPTDFISSVGADADAELVNEIARKYDLTLSGSGAQVLSYDAINPVTGAAGETIQTKPGCSLVRPNGANAGVTTISTTNQKSSVDTNAYCVDFVRSSRSKDLTKVAENSLNFYELTRDAVTWATIGGSYAPSTPLTTAQLKSIFECDTTNWAQVGGQYGAIHVYVNPDSAATYTFFLSSIGSSLASVNTGCGSAKTTTQQNDGTKLAGDPQGITPYAVTKFAAQLNKAPGINDLRGGAFLGRVPLKDGTSVAPLQTYKTSPYQVLNPVFASGNGTPASASTQGRLLFDVTRTTALDNLFGPTGFICSNEDSLLPQFGAIPLGTLADNPTATDYCGKVS